MTAKEKAEQLKKSYLFLFQDDIEGLFRVGDNIGRLAINCAIIAVDEVYVHLVIEQAHPDKIEYWINVKIELMKL